MIIQLPAIRYKQAEKEFFISAIRAKDVQELIDRHDDYYRHLLDQDPNNFAQRDLVRKHIKALNEYIMEGDYIIPPVIVEIVTDHINFVDDSKDGYSGSILIHEHEKMLIVDGNHRLRSIRQMVESNSMPKDDNIPVVFVRHESLADTRKRFSDVNKNQMRVRKALCTAMDQRSPYSAIARYIADYWSLGKYISWGTSTKRNKKTRSCYKLNAFEAAAQHLESVLTLNPDMHLRFWSEFAHNQPHLRSVIADESKIDFVKKETILLTNTAITSIARAAEECCGQKNVTPAQFLEAVSRMDWRRSGDQLGEFRNVRGNTVISGVSVDKQIAKKITEWVLRYHSLNE